MSLNRSKAIFDRFVPQIGVTPTPTLLASLFREVAALFHVERIGYWRMEPDFSAIQQEIQFYFSRRGSGNAGLPKLHAKDFPGYFRALREPSGVVISHDVMTDARLAEFQEGYFKPLGITSMLDIPVHRAGQLYGVICHEHIGPKRRWTDDEVEAAQSFAHIVALAIETEQRQKAEAELRVALDREKELSELKSNFVNLVSHEFRTPLGVIVSSADILEHYFDRLKPEQRAGHLQDVRYAAQQMAGLMEEVLLLGRVEAGKMQCRIEVIDLPGFCQRLLDEQLSATNRKCPIRLRIEDCGGDARSDEALLRHIFSNLLSNAVKYSPAGKEVLFSIRRDGADAVFEVKDQGIGIPVADQKRLFEAFYRASNVGEVPGTGLGLVIVKRCVDLLAGTIGVISDSGKGTTVLVRAKTFASHPTPTPTPTPSRNRRVPTRKPW